MTAVEFSCKDAARLSDTLILGLKKSGLPVVALNETLATLEPTQQTLAAIALAAERISFGDDKSKANVLPLAVNPPLDTRLLLPDNLRPALFRFVGKTQAGGIAWEAICRSVYQHLQASGFRLHPFDLCRLDRFLNVINVKTGSYEHWYCQSLAAQQPKQPVENINWDNWQLFGKTEQIDFLRRQRAVNPDATRAAIEKDFANASAALRQLYVEAMAVNLSASDKPFLESLANDRSGKVMEAASNLLARFPGSEGAAQKQVELKGRLTVALLTRKFTLVKQKGKKASESLQDLYALTEHIAIADIAAALDVTLDELPRKIDQELAFPFARAAAFSHDFGTALLLLQKEDEKTLLGQTNTLCDWFNPAPDVIKMQLIEWLIPLMAEVEPLVSTNLLAIHDLLAQPLPDRLAATLLNGKAVKAACKNAVGDNQYLANTSMDVLALMAVLMSPPLHQPYLAKLAEIPFRLTLNPSAYLAFISLLDQHNTNKESHDD
ncbi:hypothetical protein MGMO_46c00060 [Methyloglobulus morosus KoM1]|uniref:Uncharacterized protein n=1 Tax=Methyloglobulus morosus KoM1 TaxID=1116472 RepID=V5BY45_9GAMM|nr:DUF5691 domain-containing protein [Methyloglobulus morosus]ESS72764.1 hypothetical protein MGMO_46c00060 [Methyloglobulus morosus KoM1]